MAQTSPTSSGQSTSSTPRDRQTVTVESTGGTDTTQPTSGTTGGREYSSAGTSTTTGPSKTTTTTTSDPYKTEFVKVYQDAGVIGVAMLTLLVICVLLSVLTFRLAKMYSSLITARDSLDAQRVAVIEKLTLAVVEIKGSSDAVMREIQTNRNENNAHHNEILAESRRTCDRIERIVDRAASRKAPRGSGRGS